MPRRKVDPAYEIAKVLAKLGKASFGDILKKTGLAEPTIARHLKHMEAKKLILSEQDPKDKRKYLYWLNPNELAVITVDEAIEAIKEELKAVGEELKPEEEQALRDALTNHARPIILLWLKEGVIKDEKSTEVIFNIIATADGLKQQIDVFKSLSKLANFGNLMKKEASKVFTNKFITENVKLYIDLAESLPESFIIKWRKTKAYTKSPITQLINAMNLIMKFIKT